MSAQHATDIDFVGETLRAVQAFVPMCSIKKGFLEDLLKHSKIEFLCAGDVLFKRGDSDDRHCYLLSGRLKNLYASGYTESICGGDTLDPLASEKVRACSCIAETDATVLIVDSDVLDRTLSWSQISEYALSVLSAERDYDEDIDWMKTVLNSNLFYKVPPVNVERILTRMEVEEVLPGDVIIREGEIGDGCYFIKDGEAKVTRMDDQVGLVELAHIGAGRCFGEDALVYETLRNATVTMTTHGVLMRLAKSDFKLLMEEPVVDNITEQGMSELLEPPVLIDVRTQEEYEKGHLAMSANIPLNILGLKQRLLRVHVPYVFYCDTGRRSRAAAYLLGKQGYNAVALEGGLLGAGMQYQMVSDLSYVLKDGVAIKSE